MILKRAKLTPLITQSMLPYGPHGRKGREEEAAAFCGEIGGAECVRVYSVLRRGGIEEEELGNGQWKERGVYFKLAEKTMP